jgi:heme/copper-type cytochrome/quinol oxidase subunit 2
MLVLAFCSAIVVITFCAMFYAIWAHRRSAGHRGSSFHKSAMVEAIWTLIPCLILVATAFPAAQGVFATKGSEPPRGRSGCAEQNISSTVSSHGGKESHADFDRNRFGTRRARRTGGARPLDRACHGMA